MVEQVFITDPIMNDADVIDSRDVIARIEELEEAACTRADRGVECGARRIGVGASCGLGVAERCELMLLRQVARDASDYADDWLYGVQLIRDSYFQEFAQVLANDCYEIPGEWPFRCIDWEQVARELQLDYYEVVFDGVTYWIR